MHVQARSDASASPADLELFLERLGDINIEGVSGGGIESGDAGKFVFAVEDGREGDCHDRLSPDYTVEWTTDLYHEAIGPGQSSDPNQPGVLHAILVGAKTNRADGRSRKVDGVLLGAVTGKRNHYFAQVTFEDSVWTTERPGPHPED
jgi:hypothetical protein